MYGLCRHFHVILANGPTLEAQDWHFCNFEWQNDIFVNIVARGDGTTRIWSLFHTPAAHFLFSFLSNLHYRSPSFGLCPLRCSTRFWCFCTSLCHFYALLTEPIVGITFSMHLEDWAARFLDFFDLEQLSLMGFSVFMW